MRYLTTAQEHFDRDDLALVSYHMGIGNLDRVIAAYGGERPSYVRLFFDSTPLRHVAAWRLLAGFGDDSSTYYWRVLAAKEIMRLYRDDQGTLARRDELQTNKASAEEVLHPEDETKVFGDPDDVAQAREDGDLAALPTDPARLGFRHRPAHGRAGARSWTASPSSTGRCGPRRCARRDGWAPGRADLGRPGPLTMTSAVRGQRYQDLLLQDNIEATSQYSLHTTGYAFDVLRRYRGRAQAVGVPVPPRPPPGAEPHRLGPRAGGDPYHGRERRRPAARYGRRRLIERYTCARRRANSGRPLVSSWSRGRGRPTSSASPSSAGADVRTSTRPPR